MTDSRGGGNARPTVKGETDREESLVTVVLELIDGDLGESKEKFSSNIAKGGRSGRNNG